MHEPDLELARLRIGEEGTVIGDRVHAHPEDLAVLAEGQLTLEIHIATESRRDEVAGLVLDPLHRTLSEDGGQDRDDVAGVDGHLVAESTTEVRGHDADHVLGELGHHGDRGPNDVRGLRRHVDRELARRPVVVRDGTAWLQRGRM